MRRTRHTLAEALDKTLFFLNVQPGRPPGRKDLEASRRASLSNEQKSADKKMTQEQHLPFYLKQVLENLAGPTSICALLP